MRTACLCPNIIIATPESKRALSQTPFASHGIIAYCILDDGFGTPSTHASFTSLQMSSIHFRSAAVNATRRSNWGSRNSNVFVSIYLTVNQNIGSSARGQTHINKKVDLLLLRYDRISGATQVAPRLFHKVDLLKWKVWLEESVLKCAYLSK